MKRGYFILAVAIAVFLVLGVTSAQAAPVMKRIPYEKQTSLPYPKTYTIRFSLWNAGTIGSGKQVWFEEKFIPLEKSSTIKTDLGDKEPLEDVDFRKQQLWVQVEKKNSNNTYTVLGTRDRFKVVPYAMWSNQWGEPNPVPKFEGEVCWNVAIANRPNYIQKFRITHMGGGHYILQSFIEEGFIEGELHVSHAFGSAQAVGNPITRIIMSLHETHSDNGSDPIGDADVSGCQFFLNSSTLNGKGWCSGTFYNPDDHGKGIDYSTGTITHVSCQ